MKVLVIAPFFFERHRWMMSAYVTATELSKDHEVIVLTVGKPRFEQRGPRLKVYRLFDIFLPDPVNYSIVPNLFPRLLWLLRKEKPDVVLVNKFMFFTSLSVILVRLLGRKVIVATDAYPGISWMPRNRTVAFVMRIYAWIVGVPLLKLATFVVLYHEGLIQIAKRLRLRYRVIHNGVVTERFDHAAPAVDIPHDAGRVNVGYVGRLETIKGYDDLVAVAEQMVDQQPSLHFYFVGSTDSKGPYVLQHASDNIHFLGHRDDIPSVYRQLDIFTLCSYSEGLPNALMEAMYSGIACCASKVGGVNILIHEEKNGLTFPVGDRRALRSQLERLARDASLRQRLGAAAKVTIEKKFTWEKIRVEYDNLFHELLAR